MPRMKPDQKRRDTVARYFRAVLQPEELERHWPAILERHQDKLRALGPAQDIRSSAFDHLLELGLLQDPVVIEDQAYRRAENLAYRDPLTGLSNYGYFEQQLRIEMARARRHGTALCLILLDLDGFKKVNDGHGHSTGNEVLKDVSQLLRRGLREGDIVARLGGDEFAILIQQSDQNAGMLIAERKRREIQDWFRENRYQGTRLPVTASFGVAMLEAPLNFRPTLFDDADRALYIAKQNGRNRVFMSLTGWETPISEPTLVASRQFAHRR